MMCSVCVCLYICVVLCHGYWKNMGIERCVCTSVGDECWGLRCVEDWG